MSPYEVVQRIGYLTSEALLKGQPIDGIYCVADHGQCPEEVFQVDYAWLDEDGEEVSDSDVKAGYYNDEVLKRVILIN